MLPSPSSADPEALSQLGATEPFPLDKPTARTPSLQGKESEHKEASLEDSPPPEQEARDVQRGPAVSEEGASGRS